MRFLSTCCLLLILCGAALPASAQAQLSLTTTSTSSSTPAINDQLSIFTKLKNVSLIDTFTGPVDFLLANQDSLIYDTNIVGKPAFAGTTITLAPQEERSALFTVQLLPSHFRAGPDIIIVWPVAAVHITDSARAPIVIQPALGVDPISAGGVSAYFAADQLHIHTITATPAGRVDIYDMLGQSVGSYPLTGTATTIPLHHLPQGSYIADIQTGTGPARRLRFIR